ncbi:MAG: FAD-dependent oxidoreductase, partial [Opitutaceae bacterium]|nr:FAD-dependent oxidoreductase [Opitutaceae bacterium]
MTSANRRVFLKQAALLAAGSLAAASASAQTEAKPKRKSARRDAADPVAVRLEADVVIVGAGPGGIPAALAAARNGARVILLEQDQSVGGAPVNMFVPFLCGGPKVGVFREAVLKLNERFDLTASPAANPPPNEVWYHPSHFNLVLSELLRAEKNITLLTGAAVDTVLVNDSGPRKKVLGVEAVRPGGSRVRALGKIVVDATGTGLVGELAGAEILWGRESRERFGELKAPAAADNSHFIMPCTLMFISQRVRGNALLDLSKIKRGSPHESRLGWVRFTNEYRRLEAELAAAGDAGRRAAIEADLRRVREREALFASRNSGIYLHWGMTIHAVDTRDPLSLGNAYQKALAFLAPDIEELNRQGFLAWVAPKLGVRECRRVVGDHVLTYNDLKSGKMPDDVVSTGHYPLDIWGNSTFTAEDKHLPEYGIPLRALVAKGFDNLLLAGKNLSATHIAMGALRVQPILGAAGEGAG